MRFSVTLPTPKNFRISSFSTKSAAASGRITYKPSGLSISDAILAKNLLNDTPADAVRLTDW